MRSALRCCDEALLDAMQSNLCQPCGYGSVHLAVCGGSIFPTGAPHREVPGPGGHPSAFTYTMLRRLGV